MDRRAGDVDLTDAGFRVKHTIAEQRFPDMKSELVGHYAATSNVIRVFGETAVPASPTRSV